MTTTTLRASGVQTRTAVAGVLGAVVAAVLIWGVAKAAGAELTAQFGDGAAIGITVFSVALASLVGALAGWGLLVILRMLTANARTVWTVVAAAVAVLSLLGPLTATATTGTKLSLAAMHLAVAAVLIVTLRRATQPE